jgi:hypothetical protein
VFAALGNELAAAFFHDKGNIEEAVFYFGKAIALLEDWGAHGKVSFLIHKYNLLGGSSHKLKGTHL